jgi:hypothetical protein
MYYWTYNNQEKKLSEGAGGIWEGYKFLYHLFDISYSGYVVSNGRMITK